MGTKWQLIKFKFLAKLIVWYVTPRSHKKRRVGRHGNHPDE